MPGLEKVKRQSIYRPIVGVIANLRREADAEASHSLLDTCARHASVSLDSFRWDGTFRSSLLGMLALLIVLW